MGEATFFVLSALDDGPRHGYGILDEVAELTGGLVRLKVGTLYGMLDRLVGEGLVEVDREEVRQGRLRRYYRLTESGRSLHDAEVDRVLANIPAWGRTASGSDRERGGGT